MSVFDRKKRYLIDKWRTGENTKKIRENSSNSLSDEIFQDGLNSPDCIKIFSNCLKQIEGDVKKLFELHKECKNAQIKVKESLKYLCDKFEEMEKGNNKKDEKI